MPPGSVLLFWSIIIYHRSILIYIDRHIILSFPYAIWTVNHNLPTVHHDLPCSCTTSRSIIIYNRSISIYLDRLVIFCFLYTLWTVDHTWPTVDLYLPSFANTLTKVDHILPYTKSAPCSQKWKYFPILPISPKKQQLIPAYVLPNDSEDLFGYLLTPPPAPPLRPPPPSSPLKRFKGVLILRDSLLFLPRYPDQFSIIFYLSLHVIFPSSILWQRSIIIYLACHFSAKSSYFPSDMVHKRSIVI